jgi:glycosyltransferase involved in cell wall biosynthesis
MRILHINDRLSARGGADWHMLGVVGAQADKHDVCLAVASDDGTATAPCPLELVPGLDARTATDTGLDEVASRFKPDIIHLHNIMNPKVLEWAHDKSALVTIQDHRMFCPGRGKLTKAGAVCTTPMSRGTCRSCFDDEDYFGRIMDVTEGRLQALSPLPITVLSNYMKRELVTVGVPAQQITVIPPFVHGIAETPEEPPLEPCILFAGRLVHAKGIWDAVEAWRRSAIDLPLVFAGTGSQRNDLERAGFQVTGWLPHWQLSRRYQAAQTVIFPPRWQEPFGIVGLEALALGTPVVAWESGGIAEWHPGGELLVQWGDVDGLARALAQAVTRTGVPAEGFECEPLMQRLEAVYARVM